jgi:hypothetical protein
MEKVTLYFIILTYLNLALVPNVKEVDIYFSGSTRQTDDINSFIELVRVQLGYDTTADDEDNDSGTEDNAGSVNSSFFYIQNIVKVVFHLFSAYEFYDRKQTVFTQKEFEISSLYFNLESPPPEV